MDRALKERITGAVVLVAIAVLVVPVFLDGPPVEPGTVTEAVTLPGQDEQRRKQQTIVLERDRREPVPAPGAAAANPAREAEGSGEPARAGGPAAAEVRDANAAAAAAASPSPPASANRPQGDEPQAADAGQGEEEPVVTAAAAAPKTEPPPQAEPAASSTGMWAVQLGSFSNEQNAERLAGELRASGYAAFLSQLRTANGPLHRVRVGPQKDRESAETVAARLGGDGHKGQVVPHP